MARLQLERVGVRLGTVCVGAALLLLGSCSASTSTGGTVVRVSEKDILALQMFTVKAGVAVAVTPTPSVRSCCIGVPSRHRDYLVATSDGGTHWRITGAVPAQASATQSYALTLAFRGQRGGYLWSTHPNEIVFTADGGRTWSSLRPPGQPTDVSLGGTILWVIANFCPRSLTAPALCPSRLLTYLPGHLLPSGNWPIPTEGIGPARGISVTTRAATLLDRLGPDSAIVEEGSEGSPSSLLFTGDRGRHWLVLDNPCAGLVPTGLVAPTATTWDLYCQLDGGMNQGTIRLYTTHDKGRSWDLVAGADEQGNDLGTIGDAMATDFDLSGNGRILWLRPWLGDIKSSVDGGSHWTTAPIQTGGYDSNIAVAGSTSAWMPLPGIGLFRTKTGTAWNKIG